MPLRFIAHAWEHKLAPTKRFLMQALEEARETEMRCKFLTDTSFEVLWRYCEALHRRIIKIHILKR